MAGDAKNLTAPNPLTERDPELLQRLCAFRSGVNDMLLDLLAAKTLRDPTFRADRCRHSLEEVRATVQVLRVLTKESWDPSDLRLFDACWRTAAYSDLFADEFEAERHRISNSVELARKKLGTKERGFW